MDTSGTGHQLAAGRCGKHLCCRLIGVGIGGADIDHKPALVGHHIMLPAGLYLSHTYFDRTQHIAHPLR